ncbi:MAG TPA: hypothetical protein VEL28_11550 [Candidatus Binatia bacterium]|nr:hypothetical protein [Candidatus Binatia bacterium]
MNDVPTLRRSDLAYLLIFAVAAFIACWRMNPRQMPMIVDTQVYFYIAERAASGIAPHVSEFDPKNALSMLLTGAAMWLGRHFGGDDVMAARTVSIAVTCAVMPMLWLCAWRMFASRLAACAAPAVMLYFSDYLTLAATGSRPKIFLVFFLAAWLLATTARRPLLIGALAGACFLVWQPALLTLPVSMVAIAVTSVQPVRAAMLVLAGAAISILSYELYFLAHGAIGDQLYQTLLFPVQYPKRIPDPLMNLYRIFSMDEPGGPRNVVMSVYLAAIAAWWTLGLLVPRLRRSWAGNRPDRIALVLLAPAALAFLMMDYQGFPDRFFLLPMVALANAWAVSVLVHAAARAIPWRPASVLPASVTAIIAIAIVATAAITWTMSRPYQRYRDLGLDDQRRAAAYVGKLLERGRSVYVVSALHLLALNRTSNHTRYGFFPVRIRNMMTKRVREEGRFLPLKDGLLPDMILVSRMHPTGMPTLLRKYRKLDRPLLARQGVSTYRRREDVGPTVDPPKQRGTTPIGRKGR